jgi:hypothetical protein
MRSVVAVLLAVGGLSAAGCADAITPSNRPVVTVAGLISNGMSQPVPNADVSVRTYQPGQCGTGTVLQGRDVKSNGSGIYRAEFISGITSFTACVRVTVGATTQDTTVTNAPQFSTVQVNVVVP